MYVLLLLLGLALGGGVAALGARRGSPWWTAAGVGLAAATALFFAFLSFWADFLWFDALGHGGRFWTEILSRATLAALGAALGAGAAALFAAGLRRRNRAGWAAVAGFGALFGGAWGVGSWDLALAWLYRVDAGVDDPILGVDIAFYLLALPFWESLHALLLGLAFLAAVATAVLLHLAGGLARGRRGEPELVLRRAGALAPALAPALAGLAAVLAAGQVLGLFQLLYSQLGAVAGPGWTDVHLRLPARAAVAAALLLVAAACLVPALRRTAGRLVTAGRLAGSPAELAGEGAVWAAALALWLATLGVGPGLLQWLVVEPNEISYERPYIVNNVEATRRAFGLEHAEERQFPASGELDRETVEANRHLLSEVRLWDWRALDAVYKQFQEIRLYYEFADVDIDRYRIGDRYRQVMVSVRELEVDNLPEESQTFVNRRFKYTHGYGLTMAPVAEFTSDGLPDLLVQDIPPQSESPELAVDVPQVYYGELTDGHRFVDTEEPEFDYPAGDENVYVRYAGEGGVRLGGLWRKFLFGWTFDGTRFLLSGYPRAETRVMFHREVRRRVARLAPFLTLDGDPYPVLVDGRILWIVDAYTTSAHYPYSAPYSAFEEIEVSGRRTLRRRTVPAFRGVNYVRNSVKAVVDAYHGSVDLYVFDPDDPLILTWQRAFPGLFTPRSAMPDELEAHVRYPQDLLLTQGLVYARYHMTDPTVFYNQEDLWVRATEKYYGDVQPVEPYYVMWEPPGAEEAGMVLMLPFTPKNRQVMIGWIAGMCDPPDYGRFVAYKFPKERRVVGPQQVETKIDQDRHLSGQLTLWDQRGSQVIRGNVLAIPIDDTLLYVEPIYLRAETAAYPELRLVAVMHGDTLAYAEGFEEALEKLLAGGEVAPDEAPPLRPAPEGEVSDLLEQAREALESYRRLQGEGRFAEAGEELERLQELLGRMAEPE